MRGTNTMHIIPVDELRRQFEAGEITREAYETMRSTKPEPAARLCDVCQKRPAHCMDRGCAVCGVCGLIAANRRRRGW
jgi:hypothetical protein